jgi:hypothetical protein
LPYNVLKDFKDFRDPLDPINIYDNRKLKHNI